MSSKNKPVIVSNTSNQVVRDTSSIEEAQEVEKDLKMTEAEKLRLSKEYDNNPRYGNPTYKNVKDMKG